MTGDRRHWERAYERKRTDELGWFESVPSASLELIAEAGVEGGAAVVDVGGGASSLAARLLAAGYSDITVADISAAALEQGRSQAGVEAERIEWLLADVRDHDFGRRFGLWHDRALFHFMVEDADRDAYLRTLRASLAAGGSLVIATFGLDGPGRCSGLPVRRYGTEQMSELLPDFELVRWRGQTHRTPSGKPQEFLFALFRRLD